MLNPAHTRRLLPLTLITLTLTALFLPSRYLHIFRGPSRVAETIVAPVSHPIAVVGRWLWPGASKPADDDAVRVLEDTLEETRSHLLREMQDNDRLRKTIEDLQQGYAFAGDPPIRQLTAPVLGGASDITGSMLTIRAGTREGVTVGTVVTASGVQLLGKVVDAGQRTSTVLPINDRSAGKFLGLIMFDEGTGGLRTTLEPVGDGTLRGDVEDRRDVGGTPIEPKVGMIVRLSDAGRWPRNAQMLMVGKVEAVTPSPQQPLRKVVTVRPAIPDMERVSEVVLRIVSWDESLESEKSPASRSGGRPSSGSGTP